jgi:acyl-CoA thioesterase II
VSKNTTIITASAAGAKQSAADLNGVMKPFTTALAKSLQDGLSKLKEATVSQQQLSAPHADTSQMPVPLSAPLRRADGVYVSQGERRAGERIFGGRLVAEALLAACASVDAAFQPQSMHVQFHKAGDMGRSVDYRVTVLRDGRSICTRLIQSFQETLICTVMVTFGIARDGQEVVAVMPSVPQPDQIDDEVSQRRRLGHVDPLLEQFFWRRPHPVEFRPVALPQHRQGCEAKMMVWFRAGQGCLPLDSAAARAGMVAYASDRYVLTAALLPFLGSLEQTAFGPASLDHALWLHRDFAPTDWLLHVIEARMVAGARAFVRGEIFSQAGALVASVAQEGLLIPRSRPR